MVIQKSGKEKNMMAFKGSVAIPGKPIPMTQDEKKALITCLYSWKREENAEIKIQKD